MENSSGPIFNMADEPQQKIVHWREEKLTQAGMQLLPARALAVRRDVDLHKALDMLAAGAPPWAVMETLL